MMQALDRRTIADRLGIRIETLAHRIYHHNREHPDSPIVPDEIEEHGRLLYSLATVARMEAVMRSTPRRGRPQKRREN